jgi:hypothetical protein
MDNRNIKTVLVLICFGYQNQNVISLGLAECRNIKTVILNDGARTFFKLQRGARTLFQQDKVHYNSLLFRFSFINKDFQFKEMAEHSMVNGDHRFG